MDLLFHKDCYDKLVPSYSFSCDLLFSILKVDQIEQQFILELFFYKKTDVSPF